MDQAACESGADAPPGSGGLAAVSQHLILDSQGTAARMPASPPSDARGLGRAPGASTPASPPRRGAPVHGGRSAKGSHRCRGAGAPAPSRGARGVTAPGYCAGPGKPHPRGRTPGIGPATPQGSERDQSMATTNQAAPRRQTVRHAITFELVRAHAPTAGLARKPVPHLRSRPGRLRRHPRAHGRTPSPSRPRRSRTH